MYKNWENIWCPTRVLQWAFLYKILCKRTSTLKKLIADGVVWPVYSFLIKISYCNSHHDSTHRYRYWPSFHKLRDFPNPYTYAVFVQAIPLIFFKLGINLPFFKSTGQVLTNWASEKFKLYFGGPIPKICFLETKL